MQSATNLADFSVMHAKGALLPVFCKRMLIAFGALTKNYHEPFLKWYKG